MAPGRLDLNVLGCQLSIDPPDEVLGVGEYAMLLARPEAVRLDVGGEGYPGRISRAAYLGPTVEYEVEVAGEVLVLTQYEPGEVYPVGAEVHVQLVKEALYLLLIVFAPISNTFAKMYEVERASGVALC
jgi:ABC-type Fe3+/spermidine/putrescine transport system ATPase subunit